MEEETAGQGENGNVGEQAIIKVDEEAALKSQKNLGEFESRLGKDFEEEIGNKAEKQKRELNVELEALKREMLNSLDVRAGNIDKCQDHKSPVSVQDAVELDNDAEQKFETVSDVEEKRKENTEIKVPSDTQKNKMFPSSLVIENCDQEELEESKEMEAEIICLSDETENNEKALEKCEDDVKDSCDAVEVVEEEDEIVVEREIRLDPSGQVIVSEGGGKLVCAEKDSLNNDVDTNGVIERPIKDSSEESMGTNSIKERSRSRAFRSRSRSRSNTSKRSRQRSRSKSKPSRNRSELSPNKGDDQVDFVVVDCTSDDNGACDAQDEGDSDDVEVIKSNLAFAEREMRKRRRRSRSGSRSSRRRRSQSRERSRSHKGDRRQKDERRQWETRGRDRL